jgi:hypothetical protein
MPYTLLVEQTNGVVTLATTTDGKHLVAQEGNQYLLREVGDSLLKDNVISSYQLALLCGYPTTLEDIQTRGD